MPRRTPGAALRAVTTLLLVAACANDGPQSPGDSAAPQEAEPVSGMTLYGAGSDSPDWHRRACGSREYRQFDFWLGKWTVTAQGIPAGTNILSRELDGCAILENYESQGFVGRSLNSYDAATRKWHQHWVDHVGTVLGLFGGFRNGSMIMQGVRPTPAGNNNVDRITWTALGPGQVRQLWESSTDFGETFPSVSFDGLYQRVGSLTREPEIPQTVCTDAALPALFQFDFTLGNWDVKLAGPYRPKEIRSRITKDLSGCLIEERISGHDGYEAIVFSSVRRRLGTWERTLVDNKGTNVFLTGSMVDGKLVLSGTAPDGKGGAQDVRVTWIQKSANKFEQRWEKTRDGGATWRPLLDVSYRRK